MGSRRRARLIVGTVTPSKLVVGSRVVLIEAALAWQSCSAELVLRVILLRIAPIISRLNITGWMQIGPAVSTSTRRGTGGAGVLVEALGASQNVLRSFVLRLVWPALVVFRTGGRRLTVRVVLAAE